MTRDELIALLARVIAGLQAPVSMAHELREMGGGSPLGVAEEPARELMGLVGGWAKPEEYEKAFKRILEPKSVPGLSHWEVGAE